MGRGTCLDGVSGCILGQQYESFPKAFCWFSHFSILHNTEAVSVSAGPGENMSSCDKGMRPFIPSYVEWVEIHLNVLWENSIESLKLYYFQNRLSVVFSMCLIFSITFQAQWLKKCHVVLLLFHEQKSKWAMFLLCCPVPLLQLLD